MELKELEELAGRERMKHGLQDWTFGFATTKRRLGVCKYRTKRIEIAEFYALNNPPEKVFDTLLHEIAHALAGPTARHGPVWKAVAVRIGATPRSCADANKTIVMPGDWQATCPTCQKVYHRYRRPKSLSRYRCKCPARSPLLFDFKGDPIRKHLLPLTIEESANWEAKCAGCENLHFRVRRPKAGVWRCKCRHRCELVWRLRSQRPLK